MTLDARKKSVRPDEHEPSDTARYDGSTMKLADLPPSDTKRWITRRKAEVVAAVRSGLITLDDACRRYSLSVDEFLSWQTTLDRHGLAGLRVTRLQDWRQTR